MSYSQVGLYEISLTRDELPLLNPQLELFAGTPSDKTVSLIEGVETYVPKVFAEKEPKLSNLTRCIIYYESQIIKKRLNDDIKVIANSGLFQDLVTRNRMIYKIVSYEGQIFIAPEGRELNLPKLLRYSGKKFVKLMTDKMIVSDGSHFKSIQEIDLGEDHSKY